MRGLRQLVAGAVGGDALEQRGPEALRGGAREDRQGLEVPRNIWWGRMALYYESAKISMLRAHVC